MSFGGSSENDRTTDGKPAVTSIGIQGGIVSIVTGVILILSTHDYVQGSAAILGGLMAIWGRVKASAPITGLFVSK